MNIAIIEAMEAFAVANGRNDLIVRPMSPAAIDAEPDQAPTSLRLVPPPDKHPDGGTLPKIINLADWQDPVPLPPEIVEGVLHRGMKMVLGGSSKSFKSWVLMDLTLAVGSGGEWLGFLCRKGRALYVNFELPDAFCQRRFKAVANAAELTFAKLENCEVLNLRGHAVGIEAFVKMITPIVRSGGYSLLILDPMYKLLGGLSENAAEDVAKIMNALDSLAVECNVAIVIGHHFSKGNQSQKEAIDRVSGSGVWARDPDSLMMLTRHEEENAYSVSSILRNHPPIDDFVIEWNYPRMSRRDDLLPGRLRRNSRSATFSDAQVLDVLRNAGLGGMITGDWKEACLEQLKMSSSTFHTKIAVLRKDGRAINRGGRNFAADLLPSPLLPPLEQEGESVLPPPVAAPHSNSNLDPI